MQRDLNRRTIIAGLAAVPAAAVGAVPALAAPDAELIALGEKLKAAWQVVDAICADGGEIDAAMENAHAIREKIVAMPATTLAGPKVKASAVSLCGDDIDTDYDEDAMEALLADLQAMGAAS